MGGASQHAAQALLVVPSIVATSSVKTHGLKVTVFNYNNVGNVEHVVPYLQEGGCDHRYRQLTFSWAVLETFAVLVQYSSYRSSILVQSTVMTGYMCLIMLRMIKLTTLL